MIKEINNLVEKNDYFSEVNHESLTEEMKSKALLLLVFMVAERNSNIKSRGVTNGSFQHIHTSKKDYLSLTLDFHTFKYAYRLISKENRDAATIDLPYFFLSP